MKKVKKKLKQIEKKLKKSKTTSKKKVEKSWKKLKKKKLKKNWKKVGKKLEKKLKKSWKKVEKSWKKVENIARGTTDPGYWVRDLNNVFKLTSVRNLIQVTDSIPWVRCASGNVFNTSLIWCRRHLNGSVRHSNATTCEAPENPHQEAEHIPWKLDSNQSLLPDEYSQSGGGSWGQNKYFLILSEIVERRERIFQTELWRLFTSAPIFPLNEILWTLQPSLQLGCSFLLETSTSPPHRRSWARLTF